MLMLEVITKHKHPTIRISKPDRPSYSYDRVISYLISHITFNQSFSSIYSPDGGSSITCSSQIEIPELGMHMQHELCRLKHKYIMSIFRSFAWLYQLVVYKYWHTGSHRDRLKIRTSLTLLIIFSFVVLVTCCVTGPWLDHGGTLGFLMVLVGLPLVI